MPILNMVYSTNGGGGGGGYTPTADTIIYLPLDGDTTDTSLTPKTITNNGNAGFSTLTSGIQVLNLTGSEYLSTSFNIGTTFTVNYYINLSGTGTQMLWSYGGDSNLGLYYDNGNLKTWGGDSNAYTSYPLNTRKMITTVHSGGTRTTYIDGVYASAYNLSISASSGQTFYIGSNSSSFKSTGMFSKFIVEDRAWTSAEIADYFDNTKSKYGLS